MKKAVLRYTLMVLCAAMLAFAACDGTYTPTSGEWFDFDLRERWMTLEGNGYETNGYDGTLEIESTKIRIYGFTGKHTDTLNTLETKPFKDFPKEIDLTGYSEIGEKNDDGIYEGKIFIKKPNGVWADPIEFTYSEDAIPAMLIFNFGDGDIYLKKYQGL